MNGVMIPMKNLSHSKQRMFPFLTGKKKEIFVSLMFEDVLTELNKCKNIDGIFVITSDNVIESISRCYDVQVINDWQIKDLNHAIQLGFKEIYKRGCKNVTIIPGDIPLLSSDEMDSLFLDQTDVSIVPAHDKKGTNALRLHTNLPFNFSYGEDSYRKHLYEIIVNHFSYTEHSCGGIGFDIDYPYQLPFLRKHIHKLSSQFLSENRLLQEINS
ncbi:2-phospho-L-lactate guanylyltransferase [Neobacillus niacini]|uniref:2-phospho-L-lactate guanylyltransferase n=1 Tax=Neobacillus niacini TaxID=86668 RepID=UPI0030033A3A